MLTQRFAFALAACIPLFAGSLAAQVTPPPPGTPAGAIREALNARGLQSLVQERLRASGLTPDQIRQRLAQMGYDPTTLDPYMDTTVTAPPQPSAATVAIARTLGIFDTLPPTPAGPTAPSAAPTPAAVRLPPPSAEEREAELRVFGLSVFARNTTQFQPMTSGPVPGDYRIGPGDELALIISGGVELSYTLPVTREGFIVIPNVGQVWVNGLTLDRLRSELYGHLGRVYSGIRRGSGATTFFDVSLGRLRTNQVFVTGEVAQPGAYLVSPVASVLNALYGAGGPTAHGSYRDVVISRGGQVVRHVDLYDYLLGGDNLDEVRLEPGDVVYVPVAGDHVAARGEVNRSALYELRPGESLADLVRFAGGATAPALLRRARIERILPPEERREPGVERTVIDVDLARALADTASAPRLRPGDNVELFAVRKESRNEVTLQGAVWHGGSFAYRSGMHAWDLIRLGQGLSADAYAPRAQIVRLNQADSTLSVISLSVDTLANGTPLENPALQEFDVLTVFSRIRFEPQHYIEVIGAVHDTGQQPMGAGLTFRDAVMRAGGLTPDAFRERAFISRLQPDSTRRMIAVDLVLDSAKVPLNADTLLDRDIVQVLSLDRFAQNVQVGIAGEVHRGQRVRYQEGMTLRDLLVQAGGLTRAADLNVEVSRLASYEQRQKGQFAVLFHVRLDSSYMMPEGASRFYLGPRDSLAASDSAAHFVLQPYDQVAVRQIPNLTLPQTVALMGQVVHPGWYTVQSREERLRDIVLGRAGGLTAGAFADGFQFFRHNRRVNIDLPAVLRNPRDRDNIPLLPNDSMIVPLYDPTVVVQGAVVSPGTAVLYRPGADLEYYIANAGGYARNADNGRASVMFANGSADVRHKFLFWSSAPTPGPGSIVTVPGISREDRTDVRGIITDIVQILASLTTVAIVLTKL